MINDINNQQQAIQQLSQARFVVHFWQNLSILGADGPLFHLDTRALDVDGDHLVDGENGKVSGGVAFLKRMRLIPVTSTQRAVINNLEGFSISNVYVGSVDANGQPRMGSGMSGRTKTNVRGEWHYPAEKVADMQNTFGRYGLVGVSFEAFDAAGHAKAQKVFTAVMAGCPDSTLLEDIPEYFGDTSPYLPMDKPKARFPFTARQAVDKAIVDGTLVGDEIAMAERLLVELPPAAMQAHRAALDPEASGILPGTKAGIEAGQKRGYDRCDQWLMSQFPSYPMDTELDKSQRQLLRALDREVQTPEGFVSADELQAALEANNAEWERRLQEVAQQAAAAAVAGVASAPAVIGVGPNTPAPAEAPTFEPVDEPEAPATE